MQQNTTKMLIDKRNTLKWEKNSNWVNKSYQLLQTATNNSLSLYTSTQAVLIKLAYEMKLQLTKKLEWLTEHQLKLPLGKLTIQQMRAETAVMAAN